MEVRRERLKGAYRHRISVGSDGHIVCVGSTIDARGVGVDAVQK
jgi:hypothetical protein